MRWADLALSYLQALIWPGIVLLVIVVFRDQIGQLLRSAKTIKAFGAEAEFEAIETRVHGADVRLDVITDDSRGEPLEHVSSEVSEISHVDFSDISPDDPVKASIATTIRVTEAYRRVLRFFGQPEAVVQADLTNAGAALAFRTGVEEWREPFDILNGMQNVIREMRVLEKYAKRFGKNSRRSIEFYATVNQNTGHAFRLAQWLPTLLNFSLQSDEERAEAHKRIAAKRAALDDGPGRADVADVAGVLKSNHETESVDTDS
jgi:hypothetical protein